MPANRSVRLDRQVVRRAWRRRVGWFLAVVWLAACVPPATTFVPASPVASMPPKASITPTASAIAPATTTHTPTIPATLQATATAQVEVLAFAPGVPEQVGRFELVELEVRSTIVTANPFDPDELDIRVELSSPSGKKVEVGAFWYQEYDATGRGSVGEPGWRARFTPTETGEWSAVARLPSRGLESAPVHFSVVDSDRHGFVRVNPSNRRYFAFDDGSFFFPIGLNMAWWSGAGDALTDYRKWMDSFAGNGGNTIRVWMAEWSFGIEWIDTPLGNYENRLRQAWLLDQVFAMAQERDMYVLLVLLNCADFNNWQTKGWDSNPYNARNGGPLERADQFVTDPTARALLKRRLNYIANRWGYSPRLLAWEWWNEVNLAPFSDRTLIPWLQEMTAYLREHDVNRHMVTNSYAIRDLSPIWSLPEMDIIQKHEYATQVKSTTKDLAERAAGDFTRLANSAPAKPVLLGEFGYGTEGYGNDVDRSGIHLHNGIWATTFAGYAGSGMYWYWDVYMEAYRAWSHFRGLNAFLKDLDLSRYQPFSPLEIRGPGGSPGKAAGLGLRGDDVLVWLRSDGYTVQAATAAWIEDGEPAYYSYLPPMIKGQVLTLRDMQAGEYIVHWYDPQFAVWMNQVEVTAKGGRLTIPIPDFNTDLAARIFLKR